MKFPVIYERCPCVVGAYRHKIRKMLDEIQLKNPAIKENIVNSFLKILPELRRKVLTGKPLYCKICGEPGRNEICRACSIMRYIK
jgi:uncharacterized protein (TIGR00269 family)